MHPGPHLLKSSPSIEQHGHSEPNLVIDIAGLRPTIFRALRLCLETAVIPTVLLVTLMHTVGLLIALAAALGWCYLALAARWIAGRRLPGTMVLCVSMISSRALIALLTSSAFVYLLQPVLGSLCMALLFVGSALAGRPVTVRLARDFIAIPAHILNRRRVRRMFSQVALIWGVSRLADAGMNLGFMHFGLDAGLLSRALLSPLLTVATVAICTFWGVRVLRRDGVRLRLGTAAI
jgi:hypothetical protein